MEVGPAFHRVAHHLNLASTACQGRNLADCLLGSVQLNRHAHTHTSCYFAFLLKMPYTGQALGLSSSAGAAITSTIHRGT